MQFILTDIEGTTTDINFVHKILFPYAFENLPDFVRANLQDPAVAQALEQTRQTLHEEELPVQRQVAPAAASRGGTGRAPGRPKPARPPRGVARYPAPGAPFTRA